jgi:tetratricopeptide (TPR) repeat protein
MININDPLSNILFDHAEITNAFMTILTGTFELTNSTLENVALTQNDGIYEMYVYNTTFTDSRLDVYAGDPVIDDCHFIIESLDNTVSVGDLLTIEDCPQFSVANSSFTNAYESGIAIYNSGSGSQRIHKITNNEITDCGQMESSAAGILCYSSHVDIFNNTDIANNPYGIKSLNNSKVSITGNKGAVYVSETQQIHDNDINQIFATQGSFPYKIRFNAIYDEDNDCLVNYIPDPHGIEPNLEVIYNYWGSNFDPDEDLCPVGFYTWTPVWNLQPLNENIATDEQLFNTAKTLADSANYIPAKTTYQQVVATYPFSKYSSASLKELFAIEQSAGNDYTSLKNYYINLTDQQTNDELVKIADFLSNLCDIRLENYPDAISWYESVIQAPPSFADSLFAIIDLGYLYVKMENDSLKSAPIGSMPEYKPVSAIQHGEYRDYLLSLLFKDEPVTRNYEPVSGITKVAELLSNIPNPFFDKTTIRYAVNEDSHILIKIFDYSGRLIKSIDEGTKKPGQYQLALTSESLVPGVYFCTIESNGIRTDSGKITVMK